MNRQAGISKGCGFVFFAEKQQAQAAIDALHDKQKMPVNFSSFFHAIHKHWQEGVPCRLLSWRAKQTLTGLVVLPITNHCLAL